jgi:hypothetical protein
MNSVKMNLSHRLHLLLLFFSIFSSPISTLTPHSCYFAPNALAPDDFLPCYTTTTSAHYPCCRSGDKCLENSSCYDPDTGTTYQYGCTDSSYTSPTCPQKCSLNTTKSHWVGLVFCNGTNNLPNNTWVCHHPDNCENCAVDWNDGITRQPATSCEKLKHGKEYVAFEASWTLSDIVALPSKSRTASWWEENRGRYTSTSMTTTARESSYPVATSTTAMGTSSETSSVPKQEAGNEKAVALGAGIGIGIGIGVPLLLCIMFFAFSYVGRQRKKYRLAKEKLYMTSAEKNAAAFGGHKSELDSTPIVESCGSPAASELQGSVVVGMALGSLGVSPEMVQEEFGDWGRRGPLRVHELST